MKNDTKQNVFVGRGDAGGGGGGGGGTLEAYAEQRFVVFGMKEEEQISDEIASRRTKIFLSRSIVWPLEGNL